MSGQEGLVNKFEKSLLLWSGGVGGLGEVCLPQHAREGQRTTLGLREIKIKSPKTFTQ